MPRTRERLDSSFGAFQQQNDENFESRILVSKSRLKTASTTSALMAGFSLGAFVQVVVVDVVTNWRSTYDVEAALFNHHSLYMRIIFFY